jgi:hypothetical protein
MLNAESLEEFRRLPVFRPDILIVDKKSDVESAESSKEFRVHLVFRPDILIAYNNSDVKQAYYLKESLRCTLT